MLKSGVRGGMTGLKSSRSLPGLITKPIKGFKQGVKRKAKQVLGREVVKRARDIFCSINRPIHSIHRRLKSAKGPVQRGGLLYVSPRMLGKRRRRRPRGGWISSQIPKPLDYDMLRQLEKRYKSASRKRKRKTRY